MTMRASGWRPHLSGSLRGFFTLELPSGLIINDLTLHEKDGKRWVGLPGKPQIEDGRHRVDPATGLHAGSADHRPHQARPLHGAGLGRTRPDAPAMTPLDLALGYARKRNWPVFPTGLVPRPDGTFDKVPLVKWAKDPKDRAAVDARDPATIAKWWRRWPDAVISIPTGTRSGVIVLDIDVKKGRNGFDRLAELGKTAPPETPIAHTPSGGVHFYFACNPAVEIRNSAGVKGLGLGLDVRGDGGQVVLPGPGGYWWDPHANFRTLAPMVAPAWLGHRPPKPEADRHRSVSGGLDPRAILDRACENIRDAAAGERHDTLNREAFLIGRLVADGALARSTAQHALEAATLGMLVRTSGERSKAARDLADAFSDGLRRSPR